MTDATAGKIPHVLVIMDGVGHREAVEDNAFLAAKTPNLTMMQEKHPHSLIPVQVKMSVCQMGKWVTQKWAI